MLCWPEMATARSTWRVLYYPTKRAVPARERRLAKGPGPPAGHTRPSRGTPRLNPPRRPASAQAVTPGNNRPGPPHPRRNTAGAHTPPRGRRWRPQPPQRPIGRQGAPGGIPPEKHREPWRSRPKADEDRATPGGYGGKPPGVAFIGVPTGARNAGRCSDGGPEHRMHVTPKPPLVRQDFHYRLQRVGGVFLTAAQGHQHGA